MSDPPQSPPAKPKPGSLRDRIAAFEKPASSSSAPKPPPVRPKPGNISWKPAPPSPPSNATENTDHEEKKSGGMSASDAKESIGRGGSLKERMAALQGKGAFGGGAAPGPPPVGPKPVKRPPLVVPPPPKEESEEQMTELDEDKPHDELRRDQHSESEAKDDADIARAGPKHDIPNEGKDTPVEEEQDEETKERERRAAIAARMARLGGARVGVAPPMFGRRPEVKEKLKVTPPAETGPAIASEKATVPAEERVLESSPPDGSALQPKVESSSQAGETNLDVPQLAAEVTAEATKVSPLPSLSSPPSVLEFPPALGSESRPPPDATSSQSSHSSSRSLPISIPIPAAPRRAGPPRKKSARSLKGEAMVQDQEAPEVPLVPAEALAEAPAVVEITSSNFTAQDEASLAADQRPGSGHDLSANNDSADSHEAVSEQDLNTLAEAGEHIDAPASEEVIDEGELVQRVRESPEEAVLEDSHAKFTGMTGGLQTDDRHIPEPEHETHPPPVEVPTIQETQNITETHESEEPPSSLANEQETHGSTEPETITKDEQHVSAETLMSPAIADNSSELLPVIGTIASTVAVDAREPVEVMAQGREPGVIQDRRESEPQVVVTEEEQAEDEEADRKKRIAERLAKMGGRNPFSAGPFGVAGPPRRAGGNEPHEQAKDISSHKESAVDEQIYADVTHEGRALAEAVTHIQSHEANGQKPHVSSVAEGHRNALTALEESFDETEAIHPEPNSHLKELTPVVQPEAEDYLETSPEEQEGLHFGEGDEMAPPRITRAIPPPPSLREPVETPPEPILQRRAVPPMTREISPLTQSPLAEDDEANNLTPQSVSPDQMHTVSPDLTPISIPPVKSVRKDSQRDSSPSPISIRSMRSPSRAVPPTSSTADSSDFRSASSESSRRSFSPPPPPRTVPAPPGDDYHTVRESSPTSPQKAALPPARPPVPQMARSSSPEVPPTKPRQTSIRRSIPPPLPSFSQANERVVSPPPRPVPSQPVEETIPATIGRASSNDASEPSEAPTQSRTTPPEIQVVPRDSIEQEVLAESEPDPIDPAFYSPPRSPATPREQYLTSFKTSSKEPSEDNAEEDAEQSRRRTIAERMAKLGGIRFGAPPPVPRKLSVPRPESPLAREVGQEGGEQELDAEDSAKQVDVVGSEEPGSEEADRVRRQAIAARLAGLGGMRFGMLPQMSLTNPRAGSDHTPPLSAEHVSVPPQQPTQVVPQSSIEPATSETDLDSVSDEGVKVEAGSELSMEEVDPEDAVEAAADIPPPVPSRPSRSSYPHPSDNPPPLPGGRRPAGPTSPPSRPPLPKTESVRSDSARKASGSSGFHVSPTSDFVMVDENQEVPEVPPAPPPRSRPSRPPPAPSRDLDSSLWELPDIPRGSFDVNVPSDLGTDTSISLEDSTTYPPTPATPQVLERPVEPIPTPTPASAVRADMQLSADDLLQLWGAVGTVVHASASSLFDKSKKLVVGDGTSHGFVYAALAQVPQASKESYGHLIYSQNGNSVLRRSSNIMPGDIIQLTEAKLKGHKGLQSYHQTAGTAQQPLVGIVSEFDVKKSKVKVFQANQHVGSQTVESTSYRLDDLKSGSVKVFRVASV